MTISWGFSSKSPYAVLTLSDGTILSVSKSEKSFKITLSTADGLVIDFLGNRKICQRISNFDNIHKGLSDVEISRIINPDVYYLTNILGYCCALFG